MTDVELRPQSVLLTFFGDYVADADDAVASSSIIDILGAAGVGEHAARATLNRMVHRGLLQRRMVGRRAYFSLTPFGTATVLDGRERAHAATAGGEGDGTWTLVAFSLPDDAQRQRHDLRARLAWAGFGLVQPGLWAAPRRVDVAPILEETQGAFNVFHATPAEPTNGMELIRGAFDLETQRKHYQGFLDRWRGAGKAFEDPLTTRVVLASDWLQVIRHDPRLPAEFLDPDWPGPIARRRYRSLDKSLRPAAEREARRRLDRLPRG